MCRNLPLEQEEPHLPQLVKTFQSDCHSETFRKYKNTKCRFKFGHFCTDKTIIATPLQNTF